MTTTRKEVFAEAEAEILRFEGAKARGAFRTQLGCLAPEALEKIDEMCTNNSLKSMVSWLKSQRSLWLIVFDRLNPWDPITQKRYITVTPGDLDHRPIPRPYYE
tara:strand:- start:298 stop:609 length:312 start_codon:yes stop_codon:yes gene_type:complete